MKMRFVVPGRSGRWVKVFRTLVVISALSLLGCTSQEQAWRAPQIEATRQRPTRGGFSSAASEVKPIAQRMPWELWVYGQGINGARLTDPALFRSDELCREGERGRALSELRAIKVDNLTASDQAALALRQAGLELSQVAPTTALQTLTSYVRRRNLTVDDIDVRLSLLFGFAYRAARDRDQALAWFTRAGRLADRGPLYEASRGGIGGLLRRESEETLQEIEDQWSGEPLVNDEIIRERKRRAAGGTIETAEPSGLIESDLPAAGSNPTVVVLLPISGRFAALGKSAQQGIALALEGQGLGSSINLVVHDTGDDAMEATGFIEGFAASNAPVILGPLIAEHTPKVAEVVRRKGAVMVSFSKRDELDLGRGIFRLGATVSSQIDSLFEQAHTRLLLKHFAIVYPRDPSGLEYRDAFRAKLTDLGLSPAFEGSYARDNLDELLPLAEQLEQNTVDAVFVPDTIAVASRFFNNLSARARSKVRPLGLGLWDSERDLKTSQSALDGAVIVSPFYGRTLDGEAFIAAYQSRYGEQPDFLAAQAFDAATLVAAALAYHRDHPDVSMSDAMVGGEPYVGLTGVIRVGQDGEMIRDYRVVQFRGGEIIPIGAGDTDPTEIAASPELPAEPQIQGGH